VAPHRARHAIRIVNYRASFHADLDCHGGPQWTVSRQFYTPSLEENGDAPSKPPTAPPPLGKLREGLYSVRATLARLNPTANNSTRTDCPVTDASTDWKCATFRTPPKSDLDPDKLFLLYADSPDNATKAAGNDQLRCALRDVGTFPAFDAKMFPDAKERTSSTGR